VEVSQVTSYTREKGLSICELLTDNLTVNEITKMDGMPCMATIFKWIKDIPEFAELYAQAREMQAHRLFNELLEIADDAKNDWMERNCKEGEAPGYVANAEHIARSRLRVDTRKFMLAKVLPKIYGEKLDLNVGGQQENPVVVEHQFNIETVKQRVNDVLSGNRD
jgi:hypothetical protein